MKTKVVMVTIILFLFGFFYHSTAFSKWVTESYQPIVEEIGQNRNKQHSVLTVLSYYMINSFDKNPYLTPSAVVESDDAKIQSLAHSLTDGITAEKEKSRAIYKWITENIEYDADFYYQVINLTDFEFDSAVETLEKRKSLCMGFSHLNAALHRAIGIEAKVVYGGDHAWNEIFLDGQWYGQDSTKGAGYIDTSRKVFVQSPTMEYFISSCMLKDGEYLW